MNTIYCISELPYKESNATALDNDFTEKYMCIGSPGSVSVVESEKYSVIPRSIRTNRHNAHIIRWQRLNDTSGNHIVCASTQFFDIYGVNTDCLSLLGSTCAHPFNLTDTDWCSCDSNVLLSCSVDDAVKCWDLRDLRCPCLQMQVIGGAEQAKWAPLSNNLLCTSHGTDLRLWDKRNVSFPMETVSAHMQKISCVMWHPTVATCFLTAGMDGYIKMWNSNDLTKPRHSLGMLPAPIWKIKFSSDGNEFASIPLPLYGRLEESCALSLWKTSSLEIIQVIGCEDDVLLDLCWQKFRLQRQTYSCLYSASRYGKLRKYNLPLFQDSTKEITEKSSFSKSGESAENAFVLDEEMKELKTKEQASSENVILPNATLHEDGISKLNEQPLMTSKMEIIENRICLTVRRQIDILVAELIPLKRMRSEDLFVEQVDDKHSLVTWGKNTASKFRIKTALSLEEKMKGFTHIIIQIIDEESHLSVDEIKTILKKLSEETITIDVSLEKEPILPVILHNLLKIITSMEVFTPRTLDIPQRPENAVQFCEGASVESVLETVSAIVPKSTLSSPLLSTSYDRWIPSPRTCGARFNGSGFLVVFGRNELAMRRMQSSKGSFQDESLWLSAERITQGIKGTSSKKGPFSFLDDGHEVVGGTPRSLDDYKHELLVSMEDMNTRLQNFCSHEKCSSPLCQSISGTPFFPRSMALLQQKFDIASSGTSSLLGMRTSNSLAVLSNICSNSTQNVRSHRHRGNSGTNVLADDHHHLDGCAPISVVVIYDVSVLMSVSKDLARKYRLLGSNALELCLWNRKVVEEIGRKDLENIWQIIELCIRLGKSSWRRYCAFDESKTLTSVLDLDSSEDSMSEEDSMAVAVHPFGRSLINSLRHKRTFEITNVESLNTAKFSVSHERSLNTYGSTCSGPIYSAATHANTKLGLNFRSLQQEKQDINEQLHPTASSSKTPRKFSTLFQNTLIGHRSVKSAKTGQDIKRSCGHPMSDTSAIPSNKEQLPQDPAIRKSARNFYSLLDPAYNDRFDEVRHQYASLLFRWRMFSKAAEVMKYSETAPYSAPLRIQTACPYCNSKSLRFKCDNCCTSWKFHCSLCQLPVLGMLTVCTVCGHGGHSEHMVVWFKENNHCAYGCGCNCKSACF